MNFRSLVPYAAVFIFGLLAAGLVLLVASQPRGEAIKLIPPPTDAPLMIQVSGEVAEPGVYQLPIGSRVQDAIQSAGGFSANADPDSINLAAKLVDGTRIIVLAQATTCSS